MGTTTLRRCALAAMLAASMQCVPQRQAEPPELATDDVQQAEPLVVVAPGTAAREAAEEVSMLRVAPTIAALRGVPPRPPRPSLLP